MVISVGRARFAEALSCCDSERPTGRVSVASGVGEVSTVGEVDTLTCEKTGGVACTDVSCGM